MFSAKPYFFLVLWLLSIIFFSACEQFGCSSHEAIAELTEKTGNVERDYAAQINRWEPAPVESTFITNDGVRTKSNATAKLMLEEGSLVVMQPKTQLRFASSMPKQKKFGVVVEKGSASVEANSDDLQIETGIGLATLKKGSNIRLASNDNELAVEVAIGSARFVSSTGETFNLDEGDEILLSIGTAQLVSVLDETNLPSDSDTASRESESTENDPSDTSTEVATSPDAEESPNSSGGSGGNASRGGAVPSDSNTADIADFAVAAGQKAFVHVGQIPVAVEVQVSGICPDTSYVRIAREKIWGSGTDHVILNFPGGSHRYEVRCVENDTVGSVVKTGRLTVLRDKGKSTLSLSAPISYVDADGRDYRLMYQSKLPTVIVNWPDAPSASKYTLHLTTANGTKSISLSKPQHRFTSGALDEGNYKFKFTVSGQSKRSRTSSLKISFDNATPKAVLYSPKNNGFLKGSTVSVNGIALPGWSASVFGKDLSMDSEHRFSGTAKHLDNYLSLPVRLTHAKRGTHYFLRRAK